MVEASLHQTDDSVSRGMPFMSNSEFRDTTYVK